MGNSRTSRHADGRELYHADAEAQRFLRALVSRRPRRDPAALGFRVPPRVLRAGRGPSPPRAVPPRGVSAEVARVLLAPDAGRRIRELARRHRMDEGDVARLWVRTRFRAADGAARLGAAEAEPA